MENKIDCRSCIFAELDLYRGITKCSKLNSYCHLDNPKFGKILETRKIPEVGEDKCPGMVTAHEAGKAASENR